MAWRFVRQPNGKIARWSDVVDGFTHYDMDFKECFEICTEGYSEPEAERATHTPGPWVYVPDRNAHDYVIHKEGAKESEDGFISDEDGVVGSSEWVLIDEDDARLIAAAPELLSACRSVLHELTCPPFDRCDSDELESMLQQAIAKATGEPITD